MSKVYPKCESCCESQRRECNRKADLRLYLHILAGVAFGIGGIISTVVMSPVAIIICGAVLVFIIFRLRWLLRCVQAGAKSVHLLGCCYKMRH